MNIFTFRGTKYEYFNHWYNQTAKNERAVEIPIILNYFNHAKSNNQLILEVGNVLSHYFAPTHIIVDKGEFGQNVINEDIINFQSPQKFDLIISISTLEHIGFEDYEGEKNPEKVILAVKNIRSLLAKNGIFIFTVPKGYNIAFDETLSLNKLNIDHISCMKRISEDNQWKECTYGEIVLAEYGNPFPFANAILIGEINA